ncbi:hypothetical protein RUM43_003928 [Polyplax serrata]|uniref:Uncharacterized protein n=1 Tax=Polyplax serrata TaxID=468196 RepID=A0AAN8PNJ2_POLSC
MVKKKANWFLMIMSERGLQRSRERERRRGEGCFLEVGRECKYKKKKKKVNDEKKKFMEINKSIKKFKNRSRKK